MAASRPACWSRAAGFTRRLTGTSPTYVRDPQSRFAFDDAIANLQSDGLWLAATPDFFLEARFDASTDGSLLTLAPVYSYFASPIASQALRPGDERSVLVAFALSRPDKSPNLAKGQGATLVLGRMSPRTGRDYPRGDLRTCRGDCDANAGFILRSPYESDWFTIPLSEELQPLTLQVLVSETRSASAFLEFVSAVFGDVEDAL